MKNILKYLFTICLLITIKVEAIAQNIPINSTSEHSGGTYSIYRSISNDAISISNLRKPVIWIEGYDPTNDIDISDNYNIMYPYISNNLHNAGFDIVVLNFNNGSDYIQRNAKLLESLIEDINNGKPNNEELIVIGYSMGGLVVRYALTEMENDNKDHEVAMYISLDSPHKGAHIPVSVQALALTFDSPTYRTLFPDIAEQIESFNSPAAKQMLKYRLTSATQSSQTLSISSDHTTFLNEINSLNSNNGFPENCTNIGISLGSWNSIPQRAGFDSNSDGENDYQFSGFPALYLNFPQSENNGSQAIWNLNLCQAVGAFAFQSFLSTSVATDYPYFSDRYNYLGLHNDNFVTYWYRNSTGTSLLPSGAWSRAFSYSNGEAIDFAPGGYSNTYELLVNGLNSVIDCSFSYYNNSSFVSTISALAYNSNDLFLNIGVNTNRQSNTPFDDIFGFCGDNRSHINGQLSDLDLVQWMTDKILNQTATNCYCLDLASLSGPYLVCDEITSFSVQNLPPGSTVSWSHSSKLSYVSGQNTSTYKVKASSSSTSGTGTVTATVTNGWNSRSITKDVWVGKFNSTVVTGTAAVCPDTYYTYTAQVPGGHSSTYSYTWTYPSNWMWPYYSQNTFRIKTPMYSPEYGTVRVSILNACGTSSYSGITVYPSYNCGYYYSYYPNPVSEELTIEAVDVTTDKTLTTNTIDFSVDLSIPIKNL